MSRTRCLAGLTLVAAGLVSMGIPAWAGEQVIWAETIDEAWQLAQEHDRPMLVFITRKNCKYCTKMKSITYADSRVAHEVNERFVPVMVSSSAAGELVQKLEVKQFPTTLVITPDYYVVEQVKGYIPPQDMYRRLSEVPVRIASLPDHDATR